MYDHAASVSSTIEILGYQWYWSILSSDVCLDQSTVVGDVLAVETDNVILCDSQAYTYLLVTAGDVIHSFTLPALGIKADAIPGRVQSATISHVIQGHQYGQCSELCGAMHGFMPVSFVWL